MNRLAIVAMLLAACGDDSSPRDPLALEQLRDLNADPRIVEVELAASVGTTEYKPGRTAELWGYRDASISGSKPSVPGPMLVANQGDQIIVHFHNELSESTTIHWHGIRLPNQYDGSDHTQTPVPPGGSFDYIFTVPDAATFWFHPHVRGAVQVEKGLYAPLIVKGGTDVPVDAERVFVLDDVKLAADGSLDDSVDDMDMMFGRQGNALLVNGQIDATIVAHSGARERWRFVDAANSRFFNLKIPGKTFLVVAVDGGLLEQPYETEMLLIAPGERYDVIVELTGASGDSIPVQSIYYDRARGMLPDPGPQELFTVSLGDPAATIGALPTDWSTFEPIPFDGNTPTLPFSFHEDGAPPETKFSINGQVYPNVTPIMGTKDAVAIWRVSDDVGMDHPFHLHGMFFQVLDVDGVPAEHTGWKDTVIVPAYKTLRFAVRYGEPGHWMYHCHILEHQDAGMMGVLDIMEQ